MSRSRGDRRARTFTAGRMKRKLTAAERAFTKAVRGRRSRDKDEQRQELVGSHRTDGKDKKIQAFLEYREYIIKKNQQLVDRLMVPVIEKYKELDASLSSNQTNNFISKIKSFRDRVEAAQSDEEIDQIIKDKERFEAVNPVYQRVKEIIDAGEKAADDYKEEVTMLVTKKKQALIEKLQKKIQHLEALLEKKEAAIPVSEKEIKQIKDRIDLLSYVLEDKVRGQKERNSKSIKFQITHIDRQIKDIEDKEHKMQTEGTVGSGGGKESKDQKILHNLKIKKAELERKQKELSTKLRAAGMARAERIVKMETDTLRKVNDFQFFRNGISDLTTSTSPQAQESDYLTARRLVSSVNSMRVFELDVAQKKLALAAEKEAAILNKQQEEKKNQEAEKKLAAEVNSDVDKIMKEIFGSEGEKKSSQSLASAEIKGKSVDDMMDELFDAYSAEKPITPQPVSNDYKDHVYANHILAKANYLEKADVPTEDRLYHLLKELDRPFDVQHVQGQKQQFFGLNKDQWDRDKAAAENAIKNAVRLIETHLPLTGSEAERKNTLAEITNQMSIAASPVITDLVAAMKQERQPSSALSDEDIQKRATTAGLNYLFNMTNLHQYLQHEDPKQRSVGELLRMASMIHHEQDKSKAFDNKFQELLSKSGSLEKLELYVGMVDDEYLREVLQTHPDLREKVSNTLDLFPLESKQEPYKTSLSGLYHILEGKKASSRSRFSMRKKTAQPLSSSPKSAAPFGKEWIRKSGKIGGANSAGYLGGVYEATIDGKKVLALHKQDTKGGKVRVAKLIGEGLAGALINRAANVLMGDEYKDRIAQTELVQVAGQEDKSGDSTYLKSTYIAGYQGDFWKIAYQQRYEDYYKNKLEKTQDLNNYENRIVDYREKQGTAIASEIASLNEEKMNIKTALKTEKDEEAKENFNIQIQNIDMKVAQLTEQREKLDVNFNNAQQVLIAIRSGDTAVNKRPLIDFLVERKLSAMQRPSGVTSLSSRKVVSEAILKPENNTGSKQFLRDFTEIAAARLWAADFGLHNGNIGVAKIGGEYRIVGIDFGAAFSKLNHEVNPYSRTKTGIEAHKFYKNHFLEYDDAIIKSNEMAKAFIKVGSFPPDEIHQWVDQSIKEVLGDKFDKSALIKFGQRLGMKTKDLDALADKTEAQILAVIKTYMKVGLDARSKSLLHQGYALLLENCYDKENAKVDEVALRKVMDEYPQIVSFAQNEFRKMNLVVNNSNVPGKDALLKDIIVYHVNRAAAQKVYAQEKEVEKALDPYDAASLLEVEKLLAYENQLIAQYKQRQNSGDVSRLRMSHQGVVDTFLTYAESKMLPGNKGLELRDQILKNTQELHALNVLYIPFETTKTTLMKALPGEFIPASKQPPRMEDAPRMRGATVIAAKHTANVVRKKLIRRSDPIGFKDSRKIMGEENKSSFFHRNSERASPDKSGPKPSDSNKLKKK